MGGVNTAFGYTVFAVLILLNHHYKICSPEVELVLATLLGQICGILFNFKTTGTIVFRNKNNRLIFRFFGVYLFTYLLNYGLLRVFDSYDVSRLVAGAIIILPIAFISFLLSRRFVFNTSDKNTKRVA
ncbi:MAG: GtrA family protein [Chloroflexi bacterium]|nr:GtrA family protein [Chloroflexota bacterium]